MYSVEKHNTQDGSVTDSINRRVKNTGHEPLSVSPAIVDGTISFYIILWKTGEEA